MHENDLLRECVYSELPRAYQRHFHNAHELLYICEGAVRVTIGAQAYSAERGSLFFISKLEEHSVSAEAGPYRRYYLQLSPVQLERMVDAPGLKSVFLSRPPDFCHKFELEKIAGTLEPLFAALRKEWETPQAYSRHYVSALFNQLLIHCYRLRREQFPRPEREFGSAVFQAQEYIDRHFAEELTVAGLAARFYLSTSYLSHAFKEWTGYSPQQYLLLSRISYAKELLLSSSGTVAEISAKCGFGDESNFIRSFKKECGLSPNRYRKAERNG